jgi:sacsin
MALSVANSTSQLKLVPWAAVAAPISGELVKDFVGRAFNFLPIPVCQTTLPVHVNGYFELSSDRRDIWKAGNMSGEGALKAKWNEVLLEGRLSVIVLT